MAILQDLQHAGNHWLIPDSVRATAHRERMSPTNLGMLLNARIAAVHFGYLTLPEFVSTRADARDDPASAALPRTLLNWYDAENLELLEPRFVSTVDSGNLAAALWTLKQAALAFAASRRRTRSGMASPTWRCSIGTPMAGRAGARRARLQDHHSGVSRCPSWRHWCCILRPRRRAGSGPASSSRVSATRVRGATRACRPFARGCGNRRHRPDARRGDGLRVAVQSPPPGPVGRLRRDPGRRRSTYDLLASEARIASFVAIAKGDVPQESWFHLGRRTWARAARAGVMDRHAVRVLMPALWFRHRPGTIMHDSMCAAVAAQRKFARRRNMPWGFSESGFIVPDSADYGYAPCGHAELALKPAWHPYGGRIAILFASTLFVDRRAAIENLRRLARRAAWARMASSKRSTTRARQSGACWMSHHQGMSLLASAEALFDHPFQRAFHANPHVRATERLLDERVPRTIVADVPERPRLLMPEESAA